MTETTRVNTTMNKEVRDRLEAWRAAQYEKNGSIPDLAEAARTLIHKGLLAEGFPMKKSTPVEN